MLCLLRLSLILCVALSACVAAEPDPSFKLYLLVGQSNMAGRGVVDAESTKTDPRVLMLNKELAWVPATDPMHSDKPGAGVGPGKAFGEALAAADTTVRIGLIPCAVGGTSIKVWVPGAEDPVTKSHPYDDTLMRARAALTAGRLAGIIWHQGESDRTRDTQYAQHLTDLIARLRKDLAAPDVPFIAGELANFKPELVATDTAFNAMVDSLVGTVPHYGVVVATGLTDRGDHLHFDAASAREMGRRYAAKMLELQKPATAPAK